MLSALRLSCRVDMAFPAPTAEDALEIGPGCPAVPNIIDNDKASVAAVSRASYTFGVKKGFDLFSADCSNGWPSLFNGATVLAASFCFAAPVDSRLGETDMVVALVVAVGGRSSEARDMAAPDVAGSLPVSSRRWMRDLSSSSSSHTVEGAAVELEDSVWWSPVWVSCFGASAGLGTSGEELYGRPGPVLNEAVCFSDDMRAGAPEFDSVIEDRRKMRLYLEPASAKKS